MIYRWFTYIYLELVFILYMSLWLLASILFMGFASVQAQDEEPLTNLALNKTATASSQFRVYYSFVDGIHIGEFVDSLEKYFANL